MRIKTVYTCSGCSTELNKDEVKKHKCADVYSTDIERIIKIVGNGFYSNRSYADEVCYLVIKHNNIWVNKPYEHVFYDGIIFKSIQKCYDFDGYIVIPEENDELYEDFHKIQNDKLGIYDRFYLKDVGHDVSFSLTNGDVK